MLLPGCWQGWVRAGCWGNPAICRARRRVQPRCGHTAGTPRARAPSAGTPLFPDGCERARHGRILIAFKPRCQLLCCWNVFTALKQSQALNRVLFSILHTACLGLLLWGLVWQFLS